jgi:anti-sigma B factor antagonist
VITPTGHELLYQDGAIPVVTAPPEIDITNWTSLQAELLAASRGNPTVIVDLAATTFCDSSGTRLLLRAHSRATASGGELRLAGVGPAVMRTLQVIGAAQILGIYPDVAQAQQTVQALRDRYR